MRPLSLAAYRLAGQCFSPWVPGLLARRAARGKEDPKRLAERLGHPGHPRPEGPLVWLHGASVGESLSLLPVILGLMARRPDLTFLVTSGTLASAELLARRLPSGCLHQFLPVDTPGAARRFIRHWRPGLAIFVESELWPNLLAEARRSGARTALISARLSSASFDGWQRLPNAARAVIGEFDLVMAQDIVAAARLRDLGARDDGLLNLKLAGDALPVDEAQRAVMLAQLGERPLLLAASTHPGEDEIVLAAFAALADRPSSPLLVIVPRHPTRGDAVQALAFDRGLMTIRRAANEPLTRSTLVLVADTLGELGLWFSLARSVLVGGSLVPKIGGHNPLEPARQSTPFVSGPHVENWGSVFTALAEVDGYRVVTDADSLRAAWEEALDHPEVGQARATRAGALAAQGGRSLDAALDRLAQLALPA